MTVSQSLVPVPTASSSFANWLEEAGAARSVMAHLQPPSFCHHAGLEVRSLYQPAGILGGDFFDSFVQGPDRMLCALGDVAGKGIPAALIAATLQAMLRAHLGREAGLCEALRAANQQLQRSIAPPHFATLFLLAFERQSGVLRYVNCGHPPALLLRSDGRIEKLHATATILGTFPDWDCTPAETELRHGDALLLYTDGLSEVTNVRGEEFGETALESTVRRIQHEPPAQILPTLLYGQALFRRGPAEDDTTVVLMRRRAKEARS